MSKPKEPLTEAERKLLRKPIGWMRVILYDDLSATVEVVAVSTGMDESSVFDRCLKLLAGKKWGEL